MIKNRHYLVLGFIILTGLVPFCSCSSQQKLKTETLTITRANNTVISIETEIAKTSKEQEHGFMNRKTIPNNTGMLFVYKKDQHLSFWMKNTPHPLSIAYIDSKGIIREIYKMTPYSLNPIVANFACRYALEVPQGWFLDNNITTNDILDITLFK